MLLQPESWSCIPRSQTPWPLCTALTSSAVSGITEGALTQTTDKPGKPQAWTSLVTLTQKGDKSQGDPCEGRPQKCSLDSGSEDSGKRQVDSDRSRPSASLMKMPANAKLATQPWGLNAPNALSSQEV